jgi:hypothetical protein
MTTEKYVFVAALPRTTFSAILSLHSSAVLLPYDLRSEKLILLQHVSSINQSPMSRHVSLDGIPQKKMDGAYRGAS